MKYDCKNKSFYVYKLYEIFRPLFTSNKLNVFESYVYSLSKIPILIVFLYNFSKSWYCPFVRKFTGDRQKFISFTYYVQFLLF